MLNVTKTREMVEDIWRNRTLLKKIIIQGEEVLVVDDYNYLEVHLDNKLDGNWKIEAL